PPKQSQQSHHSLAGHTGHSGRRSASPGQRLYRISLSERQLQRRLASRHLPDLPARQSSAALAVLELQPTSRAVERLLAEGHQLFQFENGQITAAGAGEASEIDVALAIAEQQVKLALLPPSDSAELCLLTRRSATILRLRRSFSSNCPQFPSLLRHCRKIRLLHLPGYAAPKRVPSTTAESSENEAAEQKFDQLVEVATVRRADPELFLALRAWLLPPSATSSKWC
ncbi:hypothetical protein BOX15_Mlig031631g1, partial [Macrostomum lignano]